MSVSTPSRTTQWRRQVEGQASPLGPPLGRLPRASCLLSTSMRLWPGSLSSTHSTHREV